MKYKVKNISKSYKDLNVLEDISIDFEEYKTTCILGESGSGKTTLLNIIARITEEDSGQISGFENKDISFVFQEDRLIEWQNVKENIEFVLASKTNKKESEEIVDRYLKLVNLEKYKYYYPKELSGGMRGRISILRAFVYPSQVLIMDEPFKSLDINNKQIVIDLFKNLSSIEKRTCILVTHDIDEALSLGDKIVIFSNKPARVKATIENIDRSDNDHETRCQLRALIEDELKN